MVELVMESGAAAAGDAAAALAAGVGWRWCRR